MTGVRSRSVKAAEWTTNYRTTIYAAIVVLAGVAALWLITLAWWDEHTTAKAVLEQFAGILIATGLLAILWDLRGKRDIIDEVLAKVELGSDIETVGLARASMDWKVVPWPDLIKNARQIDVFIAYGSTWLSNHTAELADFAKQRRNKLRYFLPDPDDETAMTVLAERFDYTPEIISSKVVEAAEIVAKLSRAGNADIRVWYRRGAPTFTCYRFDDKVVVTLYAHKVGRGAIPTLVLDEGTFTEFFKDDLKAIQKQSREVGLNELLGDTDVK